MTHKRTSKRTVSYETQFDTRTGMRLSELEEFMLDIAHDFPKDGDEPMVRISASYPGPQSDDHNGTLRIIATVDRP